jgi:hypothetical protein
MPATGTDARRRKILLMVAMVVGFVPLGALIFFVSVSLVILLLPALSLSGMVVIAAFPAFIICADLAVRGLRRSSHRRSWKFWGWSIAAAVWLMSVSIMIPDFQREAKQWRDEAVMSHLHWISGQATQFFLDNPSRLFVGYDQLVATDRFLERMKRFGGEDYRVLFPIGRDTRSLTITFPDGRSVSWGDPPGRWPDGVHTTTQPDGSRLETTWLHGMPDGPFRAYRADGKLWGEASYVHGRLVGPAWNYPRDELRFDESAPGPLPANSAQR